MFRPPMALDLADEREDVPDIQELSLANESRLSTVFSALAFLSPIFRLSLTATSAAQLFTLRVLLEDLALLIDFRLLVDLALFRETCDLLDCWSMELIADELDRTEDRRDLSITSTFDLDRVCWTALDALAFDVSPRMLLSRLRFSFAAFLVFFAVSFLDCLESLLTDRREDCRLKDLFEFRNDEPLSSDLPDRSRNDDSLLIEPIKLRNESSWFDRRLRLLLRREMPGRLPRLSPLLLDLVSLRDLDDLGRSRTDARCFFSREEDRPLELLGCLLLPCAAAVEPRILLGLDGRLRPRLLTVCIEA